MNTTLGKYQQWYQHYYGMKHGRTFRRWSRGLVRPAPVEIAHLSMSMVRGGAHARKSLPTHEQKFSIPSHNLSESYREKRDVVKENNLRNTTAHNHSSTNQVASNAPEANRAESSAFDPTPRMVLMHENTVNNRDTVQAADAVDQGEGQRDAGVLERQENEQSSASQQGDGDVQDPRSAVSGENRSEAGRILSRPQSARSVIGSKSETSRKYEGQFRKGSQASSRIRPSSAAGRSTGSQVALKRSASAQSLPKGEDLAPRRPSEASSEASRGMPETGSGVIHRNDVRSGSVQSSVNPKPSNSRPGSVRSKSDSRSASAKSASNAEERPVNEGDGEAGPTGEEGGPQSKASRPASGSATRPASGQSNTSHRALNNDNNNNRGSAPPTSRTGPTDRAASSSQLGSRIEIGNEEGEFRQAASRTSGGVGGIGPDGKGNIGTETMEPEEVVDGTTLMKGWEPLVGNTDTVGEDDVTEAFADESGEVFDSEAEQTPSEKNKQHQFQNAQDSHERENELKLDLSAAGQEPEEKDAEATEPQQPDPVREEQVAGQADDSDKMQTVSVSHHEDKSFVEAETETNGVSKGEKDTGNAPEEVNSTYGREKQANADPGSRKPPSQQNSGKVGSTPRSARSRADRSDSETRRVSARPSKSKVESTPGSARSIPRPDSARSYANRPGSARSVKSQASRIEYIDNLSRKSSVQISSEFKSNALKNQNHETEERAGYSMGTDGGNDDAILNRARRGKDDSTGNEPEKEEGGKVWERLNNGCVTDASEK